MDHLINHFDDQIFGRIKKKLWQVGNQIGRKKASK
jgi:hypothetical protein